MSRKDAFTAAMSVFSMYGGLLKDLGTQVGQDKGLQLHAKRGTDFGAWFVGTLQEKLDGRPLDTKTLHSVLSDAMASFGFEVEVEQIDSMVRATTRQCPIYEGLKAAGWAHEWIKAACKEMSSAEYAELKRAFPELASTVWTNERVGKVDVTDKMSPSFSQCDPVSW